MRHFFQQTQQKKPRRRTQLFHRIAKSFITLLLLLSFSYISNAQTAIRAVQAGSWADPNTWDGGVPTSADFVTISNFITVEIDAPGAVCNTLLIGEGDATGSGAIMFVGASDLTVGGDITLGDAAGATGTITMDADATLTCNAVVEGDPTYSGIYETNLGTIVFNGSFTLPYNFFQFNNLVVNNGTVATGGRNLPIEGDLTINDGGTLDLGPNTANRNTIAGTLTVANGGSLRIGGGGTIPANFSTHVIGATSTIEYYGVAQTVATLNSSQNYGYLIISGSGLKEVNGTIGIARDLTVNSGIFSVNTFTANRTSAGGTLTVANGATLRISGTGTLPSNFSTHSIGATSTIEYLGAASQNVATLNSGQKYGNLTVTNGVKTLQGNITVAGTLTFGGTPNKLVIGSNTLTIEGPVSGATTARNITGSSTSNLTITGSYSRTIFFDATTNGTTNALNNFILNHSGYITTLGNALTVNGPITFTAGKLAIASNTLTVKGNLVNTVAGGLRGGATSSLVINGSVSPTLSMDQTTAGSTNALSTLQINSASQVVTMDNNLQVNGTTTFTNGKLSINGNTLTLKGAVTNTVAGGIRAGSTSNLTINGTVSPTLSFDQTTPGTTNVIKNLTINSNAQTVTLGNALRLVGTHTPTAGVFAAAGNYTIASTASGTANIAAGSTSGGYITGSVTVERYIPQNSNRGWRLLAAPASGQTINQAWQESQSTAVNGTPGYGTNLTSAAASWSSNGFDFQTPKNSVLTYDAATDNLYGLTNTSSSINAEPGYFIYIRGSRSVTPSSSISSVDATTLRVKGTLYLGNQSATSVAADKFALIGNPFASALDVRNISKAGGSASTSFYVWDPKLLGSYNLGAFQTLTPSGGNYIIVPGGGSYGASGSVVNTIESGAAFFVQATGSAGTITINESSKTSGSNNVFRPTDMPLEQTIITNLYALNSGGREIADGSLVFFGDSYSDAIDGADSRKQINFGENLSMMKHNTELVVERRTLPTGNDTIAFAMYQLKKMNYQLQILPSGFNSPNLQAFLEDRFLNTSTVINLNDSNLYSFTVNTTAGSFAENRFRIVFKTLTVLPVRFTSIRAGEQQGKISVDWKVSNQGSIKEYQIERSTDAFNFQRIGTMTASTSTGYEINYNWIDATAAAGTNYYRVKSIEPNGNFQYTSVVKVTISKAGNTFTISPNPINGSVISLQLNGQVKGKYSLQLSSATGQIIFSGSLMYTGDNNSQQVKLPSGISKGVYQLSIVAPDNSKQTQKLMINNNQ